MTQERLTMRKIREILRLKNEAGLSNRAIAGACNISNSTVGEYLRRAEKAGISWPLGELGEDELYQKLFGDPVPVPETKPKPLPDWEEVRKELRKKGVTLQLVWMEYIEKHPDGYKHSQFGEYYRRWKKEHCEPRMRNVHVGGERMQVDYAGVRIRVIDTETGEVFMAPVFVAVLPASNYTYAEVQSGENQCNWNNGHVRAFTFVWGCGEDYCSRQFKDGGKQARLLRAQHQHGISRTGRTLSCCCFTCPGEETKRQGQGRKCSPECGALGYSATPKPYFFQPDRSKPCDTGKVGRVQ